VTFARSFRPQLDVGQQDGAFGTVTVHAGPSNLQDDQIDVYVPG